MTTAQAQSLVDRSETWSDRYADDRALHAAPREAAEKLKDEGGGTDIVIEERPAARRSGLRRHGYGQRESDRDRPEWP